MGGGTLDRQVTLECISGTTAVRGLSENQRRIVSLIQCGLCQADIAKKLKFSRAYVCQTVKRLESLGEIKAKPVYEKVPGKRSYTKFYELSPDLISRIKGERVAEPFTAIRLHNFRLKVSIISQSKDISLDKRASYEKSWTMRGGPRHRFWYSGKAGMPTVSLDIHPKTIVAYTDKGQRIAAKDDKEAEAIGWRSIYAAIDLFVEQQSKFGVQIEIERVGKKLGKLHGGFSISENIEKEGVHIPGWWIDRSDMRETGKPEVESDIPENYSRLDQLIKVSEQVDLTAMPTAMKEINEKLNPLSQNVLQVQAMLQGGITISQQYEQMLNFMTKVLDEMAQMRKENAELKQKLGLV